MKILDSSLKQQTQEERFEKIRLLIHPTSGEASRELAREVSDLIRQKDAAGERTVLGLATGSTPVPFYRELIRLHREEGLSFQNVITFNLDEYFGLNREHRESYSRFMHEQLFSHIDVPESQINIPDGTLTIDEVYEACLDYERKIREAGGIDLQILGIGRSGHIGFNEPGSSRDSRTRMITLDRVTRRDAAADFLGEANVPRFAITMGVGTILEARRIVLMAWGGNKADIVREAVEGPVTDQISASFLQEHPAATFLVDDSAAASLTRRKEPWLVRSVEWDERMERRSVIWLSKKIGKPILKLVDEEYNENGMSELLTHRGPAYYVNIRVFNQLQHTITGWPGGKPGADDSNRPERTLPYPKRVMIFSPEPQDAVVSMGGTVDRLIEQGHEVKLIYATSGSLRVADVAAQKFASVAIELGEASDESGWKAQAGYAEQILEQIDEKGAFGIDPPNVRKLKGLILRGEARDASKLCGVDAESVMFLDLPFYEKGRYRQFVLEPEDVDQVKEVLCAFQPHQIYATGHVADPSSLQALCFLAMTRSIESCAGQGWLRECNVWLYRGKETAVEAHEIRMAVPMSPDQLAKKQEAMLKFQSISREELDAAMTNRAFAVDYDSLGMAEYEAIEAFESWQMPA